MASPAETYFRLYQQQVGKYFQVASISIWILDFCLTLSDEVRLSSGQKRWGLTHLLYIPTRYFTIVGALCIVYNLLVTTPPQATCVALYTTSEFVILFAMLTSEGLLLVRTLALWNAQNIARKFLIGTYSVVAIAMSVCAVISSTLKYEGICGETTTSVATAEATKLSHITVGMFSGAAFFELVIIFFTVLYASLRNGSHSTNRVVAAVTRGNMLYAVSLFVISIVNITFYVLPDGWNDLFLTFQIILHGVMASRILFELQNVLSEGFIHQLLSRSRMEFAPRPVGDIPMDEF
ncbi:hypothetical protein SCLCIDRAFT_947061 [Scleroderma citrinum Foug A]|uniref:DUF6533 domain-containing protein n=1 Tax=Scleroderma citrinum Foug A TaxID=1036808 RepID=A0A0C3A6I7_9AGAM|nr:hypothetical protein SCLCIDRAFT_947061 [Scleroderma citrinum Foug A]